MSLVRCLVLALLHVPSSWMSVSAGTCPEKECIFVPCKAITGCLLPDGDAYVFFGHNLTLNCTLINSNQSAEIYFNWKHDVNISAEYQSVISTDTTHLNMPIYESDSIGEGTSVKCVDPSGGLHSVWLEVEHFPREVTRWTAVVNNWRNLSLTWDPGKYIHPSHVNITVQWNSADTEIFRSCSRVSLSECILDSSLYNHSSHYDFNITVRNTNKNVETVTAITLKSDHYVKPAPVMRMEIFNVTSQCVTLQWEHDMETSKSLEYRVLVMQNYTEVSNTTYDQTLARICDLRPNMMYVFTVKARSTRGGYWSEPESVTTTTLEDRPDYGANVTAGGYHTTECNSSNKRNATIFLKPPSKEYQNGKLNNYEIKYVGLDGTSSIIMSPSIGQVSYLVTGLYCNIGYDVYLSVSNSVGSSSPSQLQIPEVGRIPPPESVRVAVNGSSVKVHWKSASQAQPRSWTVFWCQRFSLTSRCLDPLSWLIVGGKQNSSFVPVNSEDFINPYLFGVSMTTEAGSSGMTIHNCLYDVNKGPDSSVKPTILTVDSEPNLSLTVSWSLPVCKDGVLVTHYIVQHCPDNKTEECVNETVTSDHSKHIIPHLQEDVNYSVRLKQVAVSGEEGDFGDPKFGVPKDVYLKPAIIVAIVIASVMVVVFLGLIVRFAHGKWKEREDIKMPHIFQENPKMDDLPPQLPERQERLTRIMMESEEVRTSTDSGQGTDQSVESNSQHLTSSENSSTSRPGQTQPVDADADASSGAWKSGSTAVTLLSCQDQSVGFSTSNKGDATDVEENSSGFLNEGYDQESDSPPYVIAGTVTEQAPSNSDNVMTAGASTVDSSLCKKKDLMSVPDVKGHQEDQQNMSVNVDFEHLADKGTDLQEDMAGKLHPELFITTNSATVSDNKLGTPQPECVENPNDSVPC